MEHTRKIIDALLENKDNIGDNVVFFDGLTDEILDQDSELVDVYQQVFGYPVVHEYRTKNKPYQTSNIRVDSADSPFIINSVDDKRE